MQPFLFVNPLSGSYAGESINQVIRQLKEGGVSPTLFSVSTPAEIHACCRRINTSEQQPLVIVAGGDGTINAVVNGLHPASATLAILPMGTSNVLAAELGISSLEDGIQKIVRGKTASLAVGLLQLKQGSHRFVLMAGIGMDAAVVRDVWPLGKRLLKQGAYALSALATVFRWDQSLIQVVTRDQQIACHSVIVCNASRYGGDFLIAPEADLFSPRLTMVCIRSNQRRRYLRLALQLFRGKSTVSSELLRIPVEGVEINGIKPVQIDGDFAGYTPARITTLPDFCQIIV